MRDPKTIDYDERLRIVQRIIAGESAASLAREYDLPEYATTNWTYDYRTQGDVPRPRGQLTNVNRDYSQNAIYTEDVKSAIVARLQQGERIIDISKETGIKYSTILYWKERAGLHQPKARAPKTYSNPNPIAVDEQIQAIIDDFISKMRNLMITDIYNKIRAI